MSESSHPQPPPGPTLSTLIPPAEQAAVDDLAGGGFDPDSPSFSSYLLPTTTKDGEPLAPSPNPAIFRLLSSLALNEAPTSLVESDDERGSQGETDSPESLEIDMAPDGDHEEEEHRSSARVSMTSTAVEEGDEEDDDFVDSLPSKENLNKHSVFRSPSFDSSDLASRLAQLSVSNLATRPSGLERQPSIGGGAGITGEGVVDEEGTITDEEKMEAIIEEFGPIVTGKLPETFLYEGKGGLFRGVVIVGALHLTTHRITFHAVLPPPAMLDNSPSATLIIKSGPVWIHKPGRLTRKKRVWMELGGEMVTTYPDSSREGRTRPLKTLMLSSVREILPADPDDPLVIMFKIASKKDMTARLEFDTLESCLEWRREFSGAMFHHRRMKLRRKASEGKTSAADDDGAQAAGYGKIEDWEKVRISIPLDRVIKNEAADYMGFATLLSLEINTGTTPTCFLSAPISPQDSTSTLSLDNDNVLKLQFAVLSYQASFIEQFGLALDAARARRECGENEFSRVPLVSMDGVFKGEMDLGRQEDEDEEYERQHVGEDVPKDIESEGKVANAKLRVIFGLTDGEALWSTSCGLQRSIIPLRGHLIISSRYVGFYRKTIAGHDIKYRWPLVDVKGAEKASTLHLSTHGLALQVAGHADTIFEFFSKQSRNTAIEKINEAALAGGAPSLSRNPTTVASPGPVTPTSGAQTPAERPTPTPGTPTANEPGRPRTSPLASTFSSASTSTLGGGRSSSPSRSHSILTAGISEKTGLPAAPPPLSAEIWNYMPKIVNYSGPQVLDHSERRKIATRHFVMLTIGSRGDIQPYIALSLGLMKDGHRCTIVTHDEFKPWVESFGIGHRQTGGDPEALMKLSVQHKMFSPGFFKESLGGFRGWLDDLFHDSWVACHDADVLIESPSAFCGIHIAEGLKIPYFRAFTMTWTRTQTYPHAFLVPPFEVSGSFNYSTYVLFDSVIWKAMSGQINRWRKRDMGLPPTDQAHLEAMSVPFVYNFSSAVVPHPIDWPANIEISGYWFLDDSDPDWTPPDSLNAFILRARDDKKAIVYIGFGSIVVPHPAAMTRSIIKAVQKADVRAIIAKGWSDRGGEVDKDGKPIVVEMPEEFCYPVQKVPHDWLFGQIDAAVHHGGAGTTGASLRAGLPTIIKPWFGDQFFWGNRVQHLGCGIKLTDLHSNELASALVKATTDRVMREAAQKIGEKIRSERGVDSAIAFFYSYLGRAADRHAPYKPVHTSNSTHGSSSPRRGVTFSTAALTTMAAQKLHGLVASTGIKALKDEEGANSSSRPKTPDVPVLGSPI